MNRYQRVEIDFESLGEQQEYLERLRELLAGGPRQPLAAVHSYGCQGNAADTERIRGILAQMGYGFTDDPAQADLILYNTCAVRENAEDRVFGNVGALKKLKEQNPRLMIVLCGCMTQQKSVADKIKGSYPYVDLVLGAGAYHLLPKALYERMTGGRRSFTLLDESPLVVENQPVRRDEGCKAWLPIMYGCDNFCSYCIVPYVRGRERSRTPAHVIGEARRLIADGVKDITLLGQNVNSYGKGLAEETSFARLLEQLNALPGEFRIRFMTSHPKDCTRELIDTIARCDKVCKHIHLPLQSGSDRVLREMNRRYTVKDYLALVDYAREKIPGVSLTSDIIVGFPGETREEFEETLAMLRRVGYTSLFTFIYSRRSGTRAASMEDPVPEAEKSRWLRELLEVQEPLGFAVHEAQVGKTLTVLADGIGRSGEGMLCGRTDTNIIVEFPGSPDLIGQFVPVRITQARNWALLGERI